jgi:hypothetical protein
VSLRGRGVSRRNASPPAVQAATSFLIWQVSCTSLLNRSQYSSLAVALKQDIDMSFALGWCCGVCSQVGVATSSPVEHPAQQVRICMVWCGGRLEQHRESGSFREFSRVFTRERDKSGRGAKCFEKRMHSLLSQWLLERQSRQSATRFPRMM